jgi:EAL and modified HD-GYP domain-containing signal transduction protein
LAFDHCGVEGLDVAAGQCALLARHPLFDRRERVAGYELLCRSAPGAPVARAAGAITTVVGDVGLERLVGDHPAYMTASRELLAQAPGLGLPPQRVVLQLPEPEPVDRPLLTSLRELRDLGFGVGVGIWALAPGAEPALEVATVLKVRFGFSRSDVNQVITRRAELHARRLTLIATGVETRGEYDQCLKLGFDAFQGPLFPRSVDITPQRTPTFRLSALATVAEGCSFEELERLISQDAGLAHRFLRLSNSAFFAARAHARSIHDALLRLGSEAVQRWTLLLLLSGLTDTGSSAARSAPTSARRCYDWLGAAPPLVTRRNVAPAAPGSVLGHKRGWRPRGLQGLRLDLAPGVHNPPVRDNRVPRRRFGGGQLRNHG